MTKIIYITYLLFIFSTNALAISSASTDIIAKDIAAKTSNLQPKVIKMAIAAFHNAKQLGVEVKKPILTIIDYTLPSIQKRLWVIDLEKKQVLFHSLVAHGKNSGENYTTSFSNRINSKQSSLGVFLTEDTYMGKHGYSLHLQGLEKGFNDNAKVRTIVLHSAHYVNNQFGNSTGRIGRSFGCQAVEESLSTPIINAIKGGTLLFSFYPHHEWLSQSKFLNG